MFPAASGCPASSTAPRARAFSPPDLPSFDAFARGTKERDQRFCNLPEDPPQAHTGQTARLTDGYRDTRLRLDRAQDFHQDRQSDKRRRRSTMTAMKI